MSLSSKKGDKAEKKIFFLCQIPSLWCSRTLLHELLKSRPLASGEIREDMTVGTKALFQDKQKWVWKCPSLELCIHTIPLKHPDLENGDLARRAFVNTVDKVARAHPKLYVKQYFRGWAGGWMSNLDFVSPYLHYLHQNGPSLALNPLSGEQISLNLYASPPSVQSVSAGLLSPALSDIPRSAARMI